MKLSQLLVLSFVVWLPGKSRAWGRPNLLSRGACRSLGMSEVPGLAPRPAETPRGQVRRQASWPGGESEDRKGPLGLLDPRLELQRDALCGLACY